MHYYVRDMTSKKLHDIKMNDSEWFYVCECDSFNACLFLWHFLVFWFVFVSFQTFCLCFWCFHSLLFHLNKKCLDQNFHRVLMAQVWLRESVHLFPRDYQLRRNRADSAGFIDRPNCVINCKYTSCRKSQWFCENLWNRFTNFMHKFVHPVQKFVHPMQKFVQRVHKFSARIRAW